MALHEYQCLSCHAVFEQLTSQDAEHLGTCPHCNSEETKRLISVFAVAGRGDLRESTLHGCHDANVDLDHDHGHHDHDHDHGDK